MSVEQPENAARVAVSLVELDHEPRSSEKVFVLSVQNLGTEKVSLTNLYQSMPEGVELRELWPQSLLRFRKEHDALCQDLTLLLNDEVFFSLKDIIEERKKLVADIVNEAIGGDFGSVVGIVRWYVKTLFRPYTLRMITARFEETLHATDIRISGYHDAKSALDKLGLKHAMPEKTKKVFEAKLDKLQRLEAQSGEVLRGDLRALATINPGSSYSENFVFRFERDWFSSKKYNLMVEAHYLAAGQREERSRVSASVNIIPSGITLSVVAILFAFLGVLFKQVVLQGVVLSALKVNFPLLDVLSGCVLGFLVFHVYEYLGISKLSQMEIDWRSAALVGFACGLFQENLVSSIRALFGFG